MTFQDRHLLQEAFLNDNKMKYAKGGMLGAGLMAAGHIMGDSDVGEGLLDDLKTAHNEGNLQNTMVDKAQSAVGWFKSDNSGSDSYKPPQTSLNTQDTSHNA